MKVIQETKAAHNFTPTCSETLRFDRVSDKKSLIGMPCPNNLRHFDCEYNNRPSGVSDNPGNAFFILLM